MARLVCVSLLLMLCAGLVDADRTDVLNSEMASAYFRGARRLLSEDLPQEARRLLEIALEFDPENSDASYLAAQIASNDQARTLDAIAVLESALRHDTWRVFDETQGRLLLSAIRYRTRDYEGTLRVLSEVTDRPPPREVLLYRSRALAALDRTAEATGAAELGKRLYPDEAGFDLVLLQMDDLPGYRWGRRLRLAASSDPDVLRSLLYYAARQPIAEEAREILDLYFRYGGDDPLAALTHIVVGGDDDLRTFEALGGLQDLSLIRRAYEISAPIGQRDELRRYLQSYTGWIETDADRDGFYESRTLASEGILRRVEFDSDQNGEAERELFLDGTRLLAVIERSPPQTGPDGRPVSSVRIDYAQYPEVRSTTFFYDDVETTHDLIPNRLRYEVVGAGFADVTPQLLVPIDPEPAVLDLDSVARFTYRTTERRTEAGAKREFFANGVVYLSQTDSDGDGAAERVVHYEGGVPRSGLRDLDGDGMYEVSELYADGELAMLIVDSDLDGVPEFRSRLGDTVVLAWDLDQDGEIDIQELAAGRRELLQVPHGAAEGGGQ